LLHVSKAKLRDYGKRDVNMATIWMISLAFVTGLTVAGLSGSILEIACGARLRLGEPFLDRRRIALSMCASAAAGPFMLVNDALAAREERRIGGTALIASLVVAALWLLATGVLTCELAILIVG
jgi:hypothetical protein